MEHLSEQRCFNHRQREAAARCPGCRRYFCRECVTEHEDRVLCSACLSHEAGPSRPAAGRFALIFRCWQFAAGGLVVWLFFYLLGRALLAIPSEFHEGTIWRQNWWGG